MQKLELSHQQRHGWQHRSRGFTVPETTCRLAVRGPLDRRRLEEAINAVVDRHEALRTRIEPQPGMNLPVQAVYETAAQARNSAVPHEGAVEIGISSLADDHAELTLSASGLLVDRFSCELFAREVAEWYAGAEPPTEPLQYGDYAAWVDESLSSADTESGRAYWAGRNIRPFAEFALAVAKRTPPRGVYESCAAILSAALSGKMRAYAERCGATVESTILAAWCAMLYRHASTDEVALGLGRDLRPFEDLKSGIGLYHQHLPLSVTLSDESTFAEVIRIVHDQIALLDEWQDCFSWELADPERSITPRYQLEVVRPVEVVRAGDVTFEVTAVLNHLDPFELKLVVEDAASNRPVRAALWFDASRIEREQAARFLPQLELLLDDAMANDERPIGGLKMIPAEERDLVAVDFNRTGRDYPADSMDLVSLFRQAVARFPDRPAIRFSGQALTYRQLDQQSSAIARLLRDELHVEPNGVVALMMERSIHLVPALYGVLKCGAAYLPLDADYPDERLQHILTEAKVACVLCDAGYEERLAVQPVPVVCPSRLDFAELPSAESVDVDPRSAAYIIYTSGSTGLPKGVLNEHGAVCNLLHWLQDRYELTENDRVLQKTPYTFDVSVPEFFWPLNVGALVVLAEPEGHRDPGYLVNVIREERITVTSFVPTMLRLFLEHRDAASCTTLSRILCAGEALVGDLRQRFRETLPETGFFNLYGPTETAVYVTEWDCSTESPYGVVPIGRPIANTQIRILDDLMQHVPIGVRGNLYIGGHQVARGYVNREDLTADRFIADPFGGEGARLYKSGDIARSLPDGSLAYLGRSDSQIKLRGLRIELGEIEEVLASHPAVAQCTVIVRDFSESDRRLVAYLVAAPGLDIDVEAVRQHLADRVPEYMIPAHFEVLDDLPTTSSGKVDRKLLPEPQQKKAALEYIAPRNDVERYVVDAWKKMLRAETIGISDNFFELGGDSLQAAIFCNQLSSTIDDYVSVVAVFEHGTPETFAAFITDTYPSSIGAFAEAGTQEAFSGDSDGIVPIDDRPDILPLSGYQARTWFIDALEEGNPAYNTFIALTLRGEVDITALRNTVRKLIERHEILRTRYYVTNGRLVQGIVVVDEIPFSVVPLDEPLSAAAIERCVGREAARRFALEDGSVIHVCLYCGTDGSNLLIVDAHQIATDAWCRDLLVAELAALYRAELDPGLPALPSPKLQHGDYLLWQRRWLAGPDGEKAREFWRSFLKGRGTVLDLPVDKPRPPVKSNSGARLKHTISGVLLRQVYELSGREHVSSFMVLFATFFVLLAKYCEQEDIIVGSTVACREREETRELMGRIANMIAVPASVGMSQSFLALLGQVRDNLLAAYTHQEYPLLDVLAELSPPRDLSQTPLYQVVFAGETRAEALPELPGLELGTVPVDKSMSKYDLTLVVMEEGGELLLDLEYCSELFDRSSMMQLLSDYETCLAQLVARPDSPIGSLEFPKADHRLAHASERTRINGFPVSLPAVRRAIGLLDGIEGCDVEVRTENGRDVLVASYRGEPLEQGSVQRMLAWTLPSFMIPERIVHAGDRTSRAPQRQEKDQPGLDWLEQQVVDQWRDLLGKGELGVNDDFFEAGGNSMLALDAAHRASRSFGVPVTLRHFFEASRPRELAEHIRNLRSLTARAGHSSKKSEIRL